MPFQPWRAALQPASLGGVGFHVEVGSQASGRRIALHEYPKLDTPYAEDMGRRARRWPTTGYCIGPYYLQDRDALTAVLEVEGPFTFVHPSLGENQVVCEGYSVTEVREKGGFCVFEMQFVETGASPDNSVTDDTQAQATSAANDSNGNTASTVDGGLASQGGIGSDAVASAGANANITPVTTPTASPTDSFGGPSAPTSYPGGVGGIGSA